MGEFNLTAMLNISFFDFLDELSSKYMLPIGGALTALFILNKWSVKNFLSELLIGVKELKFEEKVLNHVLKILLIVSSFIVGLIIINELFDFLFNKSLQKIVGF